MKDAIISLQFLVNEEAIKEYAFVLMPNHIHFIWQVDDKCRKSGGVVSFLFL
jgi:putative transposase